MSAWSSCFLKTIDMFGRANASRMILASVRFLKMYLSLKALTHCIATCVSRRTVRRTSFFGIVAGVTLALGALIGIPTLPGAVAELAPAFLTGTLPVHLDIVVESSNATGTSQVLSSQVQALANFAPVAAAAGDMSGRAIIPCSMALVITSAASSGAQANSTKSSDVQAVDTASQMGQLLSYFNYSLVDGTVDVSTLILRNGTLITNDAQLQRLYAQVASSILNFR